MNPRFEYLARQADTRIVVGLGCCGLTLGHIIDPAASSGPSCDAAIQGALLS